MECWNIGVQYSWNVAISPVHAFHIKKFNKYDFFLYVCGVLMNIVNRSQKTSPMAFQLVTIRKWTLMVYLQVWVVTVATEEVLVYLISLLNFSCNVGFTKLLPNCYIYINA